VAIGNGISVLGFVGFLFSHAAWQIVIAQVIVQFGSTCYWMASGPLTVLAAQGTERARWFGFVRALRNVGVGFGGVASAVALSVGTIIGLRAVMVTNAVTFALAAWLILTWRPAGLVPKSAPAEERPEPVAVNYLTVLRDARYLRLGGVNVAFVFASMVLSVLLAVYTVDNLGVGA